MSDFFNLNRAALLFKSIFIENKRVFIALFIFIVSCVLISSFTDVIMSADGVLEFNLIKYVHNNMLRPFQIVVLITLFIKYRDKLYSNISYMVPASVNEKFFVPFFISLILVPILFYLVLIFNLSIFWFFSANTNAYIETIQSVILGEKPWMPLFNILFIQSFMCLGLISTKRYFWLGPIIFCVAVLLPVIFAYDNSTFRLIAPYLFCVLVLTSWIIVYLRFKKMELNR